MHNLIYIENDSLDPYFNFALEYYLLKELDLKDDVFLFWRTVPTLMIGRHQNTIEEINCNYVKEKKICVVRRITGGGTIYTDPNGWQFSYIVKKPFTNIDFSEYVKPVINALAQQGIEAKYNDRNDIYIKGKKISGNSQYCDERCGLHHGSILFNTDLNELVKAITVSDDKIISKGLKSVRERVTNVKDHFDREINSIAFKNLIVDEILRNNDKRYALTLKDIDRVNEIRDQKFKSWEWNYGKSPKFKIIKSKRYEGGKIEFHLNIKQGCITECKIYGDFFCKGDIDYVSCSLAGCFYKEDNIRAVLKEINAESIFYKFSIDELVNCLI